jgi:biopolymer transport protein ExbD
MGQGKARLYNIVSMIFVVLSLLVIIFVITKLLSGS